MEVALPELRKHSRSGQQEAGHGMRITYRTSVVEIVIQGYAVRD